MQSTHCQLPGAPSAALGYSRCKMLHSRLSISHDQRLVFGRLPTSSAAGPAPRLGVCKLCMMLSTVQRPLAVWLTYHHWYAAGSNDVSVTVVQVEEVRVNRAMAESMKKRVESLMNFLVVSACHVLSG